MVTLSRSNLYNFTPHSSMLTFANTSDYKAELGNYICRFLVSLPPLFDWTAAPELCLINFMRHATIFQLGLNR